MKPTRIVLLVLLAILVVIQFIPALPANGEDFEDLTFVEVEKAPREVRSILQESCYDCHSNVARWPWYGRVAPVKFWLADHVIEGREHLNFSEWATYEEKDQIHALEEMIEEVEEDKMPLREYTRLHRKARLSEEKKAVLLDYLRHLYQERQG